MPGRVGNTVASVVGSGVSVGVVAAGNLVCVWTTTVGRVGARVGSAKVGMGVEDEPTCWPNSIGDAPMEERQAFSSS